ncbi:MAG: class I SAM-dependent RNA methyltransferase [Firmicutes bacterium]|nr:class I SAM-dependent RNA methyltransferase [Bacillota bacterium]
MQVPTLFGLEGVAADELKYGGFSNVQAQNGYVTFEGDLEDVARANMMLRTGERVLIVLARFEAKTFDDLFEGTKDVPWENLIGSKDRFPVKGWSLNSQLHSVPDCQKIIKKAVVSHLKECYGLSWFEETGSLMQIQFSIMKDQVTLMLDTTGPGLYKRGYKRNETAAPLRETLSAGIADLSRVHSDSLVVDPMCGSGTLLIESAMKALNIAPGLKRRFSFENWKIMPPDMASSVREDLKSRIKKDVTFEGFGFDIDASALQIAAENAKRAGVDHVLHFKEQDIKYLKSDSFSMENHKKAVFLCNPPYGERLMDIQSARELYRTLGVVMKPLKDHAYSLISPDEAFEAYFGRKASRRRKLYNGMLKCQLYMYY